MIKRAFVNGEEISQAAVQHEFDRLARLYSENGMPSEELKANVEKLLMQAQEQAVGAKLILLRAAELGLEPDDLIAKTCAGVPDPGEAEMEAFFRENKSSFGELEFVQVQDKIRNFLRHAARGKVLSAFIAELRERFTVDYRD